MWAKTISGHLSSSETQNARCQPCRAGCFTLNLVVWCQSKHVYICHKANLISVKQGVKMLSPRSIFGMTGTDAMDVYLTGGVDRSPASGTGITAAAATSFTITFLHNNHQQPSASTINNHKNSHHELALQQEEDLGQVWEKHRNKRRPCSGRTSRSLWAASREEQRLRRVGSLRAISSAGRSSRTTAPTLQQRRRNITDPFS